MSIEQVALAMWAGYALVNSGGEVPENWRPVDQWRLLGDTVRASWRTRARTYLRALGRIK